MSAPQWFACYPTALLGALAGMSPEEGYTYTVLLLRIYEADGPVAETPRTLSRRTGLPERKITQALETLIQDGRVERLANGHLDSPKTHDELDARAARRGQRSEAGKASAERRSIVTPKTAAENCVSGAAEKDEEIQRSASTAVAVPLNARATGGQLDTVTVIETPSETSSLRDARAIVVKPSKATRAHRLPDDWWPDDEMREFARSALGESAACRLETEKFKDHWASAGGQSARKLDWRAAYRNWIREAQRRMERSGSARPRDAPRQSANDRLVEGLWTVMEHLPDDA